MTTYIHDDMLKSYETLILNILQGIEIIELRRIIWEKLVDDKERGDILNQQSTFDFLQIGRHNYIFG